MRQLFRFLAALRAWWRRPPDGYGAPEPRREVRAPGLDRGAPTLREVLEQVGGVVSVTLPEKPLIDFPEPELTGRTRGVIAAAIAEERRLQRRLPSHYAVEREVHAEVMELLVIEYLSAPIEETSDADH